MTTIGRSTHSREPVPDHEQKRVALGYLHEAWAEARLDGIDGDCLAQACLFAALAEFVTTYGEEAAATSLDRRAGELGVRRHLVLVVHGLVDADPVRTHAGEPMWAATTPWPRIRIVAIH